MYIYILCQKYTAVYIYIYIAVRKSSSSTRIYINNFTHLHCADPGSDADAIDQGDWHCRHDHEHADVYGDAHADGPRLE